MLSLSLWFILTLIYYIILHHVWDDDRKCKLLLGSYMIVFLLFYIIL